MPLTPITKIQQSGDGRGTPAALCLMCIAYACFLQTNDISMQKLFVGVAEHYDNAMTFIPVADADPTDGCNGERISSKDEAKVTPEFQPSDPIGLTFLMEVQPGGQKFCAAYLSTKTSSRK